MLIYKCEICNDYEILSDKIPEYCKNCGAQNGPWEKIREVITISFGDNKYIIYKNQELGRKEMKSFFNALKDDIGNSIYKYCETDKPMLLFRFNELGEIYVFSEEKTQNYFILNNSKIENLRLKVNKNDKLNLFSSKLNKIIISFDII